MAQVKYIISFTFLLFIIGCKTYYINLSETRTIDTRLVGEWEGSENHNRIEGMLKEWHMVRNSDGSFILNFKTTIHGKTFNFSEKGMWWIEDKIFHEHYEASGKTDKYKYVLMSRNEIKFTSISLTTDNSKIAYKFIDNRKSS